MLILSEDSDCCHTPTTTKFNAKFELPDVIGKKERRPNLRSYAAQLRAYGAEYPEIKAKVFAANEQRCHPPLATPKELNDLDRLCQWAAKQKATDQKPQLTAEEEQIVANVEAYVENVLRPQLMPDRRFKPNTVQVKRKKRHKVSQRSLYTVAKGLLAHMREAGSIHGVAADSRSLAERIGLHRGTVSRALLCLCGRRPHDFIDEPLFSQVVDQRITVRTNGHSREFVRHCNSYSLNKKVQKCTTYSLGCKTEKDVAHNCTIAPFEPHDAFLSMSTVDEQGKLTCIRGLPRSVHRIYETLPVANQKKSAEESGFCLRTVKTAFLTLEEFGMIEKKGGLWIKTAKTLDELATERGTKGAMERRHTQFEEERRLFRENDVAETYLGIKELKMVSMDQVDDDKDAERGTIVTFTDEIYDALLPSPAAVVDVDEFTPEEMMRLTSEDGFVDLTLQLFAGARIVGPRWIKDSLDCGMLTT